MSDLNWYIMNKDHDGTGKIINYPIGLNPPPKDDHLKKLQKPSKSRERTSMNPSQLLINL